MRWLFLNPHPLREALQASTGEEVVNEPGDYQQDHRHMGWLRELAATAPPGTPDPIAWAWEHAPDDAVVDPIFYGHTLTTLLPARRPDVVVLTPVFERGGGWAKDPIIRWRNRMRGRGVLVGIGHDPGTFTTGRLGHWRPCVCRVSDVAVYVTDDAATAAEAAHEKRTALWTPGASPAPVIAAATHAYNRREYAAGPRSVPFT